MEQGLKQSFTFSCSAHCSVISIYLLFSAPYPDTLQTHHVYSTLKQRGNDRFPVVSTWNTRGVLVGY